MEAHNELKKPTQEEKKAFREADNKLDEIKERNVNELKEKYRQSNIEMKEKIFMKISDVDKDDARWFKKFCDCNCAGKQFLGIKVIRTIIERMDPFLTNIIEQINQLNTRMSALELILDKPEPEKEELEIPPTQGSKKQSGNKK